MPSIAILGFGNQGVPWAHNLRDSGWDVTVLLRPGSGNHGKARAAGFAVDDPENLARHPVLALLIPDDRIADFAREHGHRLRDGQALVFAHGYALHFQTAAFPAGVDLILLAPKGIGSKVREEFLAGRGVPCVLALHQDATGGARGVANALARGLGADRAGIYEATVRDEVEADLLSEQALLCGGVPALVQKTFEILVARGIPAEVAYLECVHELGFMAELFQRRGFHRTLLGASPTAQFGGFAAGPRLVDGAASATLERLHAEIRDGTFAKKLSAEAAGSYPLTTRALGALAEHPLEETGARLRNRIYRGDPA